MESVQAYVGLCKDCDYPLRGLPSNRCPECGREFDPKDPGTMNMGLPTGPLVRMLLRPMGRVVHMMVLLTTLMLLWGGSLLPGGVLVFFIGLLAAVVLTTYQASRIIVFYILSRQYRQPRPHVRWQYVVWPMALAAVLGVTGATLHLMVWFHRPLLDRFAERQFVTPDLRVTRGPQRIGLLYFQDVYVTPGGTTLSLWDGFGIHHPYGDPRPWEERVSGRWYWSGWWPLQFGARPRDG